MVAEIEENKSKLVSHIGGIKDLLGVGMHLLLLGLPEGLAAIAQQWISFPVSLAVKTQILCTVLCVGGCLLGAIWFNRSLDLIKVHLLDGKKALSWVGSSASDAQREAIRLRRCIGST
jgi:hypothetical protein